MEIYICLKKEIYLRKIKECPRSDEGEESLQDKTSKGHLTEWNTTSVVIIQGENEEVSKLKLQGVEM